MSFSEAAVKETLSTVVQLRSSPISSFRGEKSVLGNPRRHGKAAHCSNDEAAFRQVLPTRRQASETINETSSSQDLLQFLLSNVCTEEQASVVAKTLFDRFTTLGNILTAQTDLLVETCDEVVIFLLRNIYFLMKSMLREPVEDRILLRDLSALYDYLRLSLSFEQNEVVRLLFLNSKNALLHDELHSKGTINQTPVYPREIVKRVIELNANALIIVHNHPSGDPSPSNEDVEMTRLLKRVLADIGVMLHDHIIVGRTRCESLKSLGLM